MTTAAPRPDAPADADIPALPDPFGAFRVAVLIPCYNEAVAIGDVVRDFRTSLPQADVYVYDNNSTDGTVEAAAEAGAVVRRETRQGKGRVVRRMFADVEADIYLLVDGDGTYDAGAAPDLVAALIEDGLDMVSAARVARGEAAYRRGHRFGNWAFTTLVSRLFGKDFRDLLSGYRVLSRRFVKSFPAMSGGFEIETELTVHALELEAPVREIETAYQERPAGSQSKLSTVLDGLRILRMILDLAKQERPMLLFGAAATGCLAAALVLAAPVLAEYWRTGLVPRLPTAVLCVGLVLEASLAFAVGLVLDTVTRGRREAKRMRYLEVPGVAASLHARA